MMSFQYTAVQLTKKERKTIKEKLFLKGFKTTMKNLENSIFKNEYDDLVYLFNTKIVDLGIEYR